MISQESELDKFRRKWSEKLSIQFWATVSLASFALLVVVIAVAIPNTLGTDHKVYIVGVVAVGLLSIVLLLFKARSDSSSLLVWTKVCDVIATFIIGITVGQLTRNVSLYQHQVAVATSA